MPTISRYSSDIINLFTCFANPLCAQYSDLRMMNESMPKELRVDDSWFESSYLKNVDVRCEVVDYFDFYFVAKENLEQTFKYNLELMKIKHGYNFHCPEWLPDHMSDIRVDNVGYDYKPGIHIIATNLVNGWDGGDTVFDSPFYHRIAARDSGKRLIGVELLAAFALQPITFLKHFDGVSYPKFCLAGINFREDSVFGLNYDLSSKRIEISRSNEFRCDQGRLPLELIM